MLRLSLSLPKELEEKLLSLVKPTQMPLHELADLKRRIAEARRRKLVWSPEHILRANQLAVKKGQRARDLYLKEVAENFASEKTNLLRELETVLRESTMEGVALEALTKGLLQMTSPQEPQA